MAMYFDFEPEEVKLLPNINPKEPANTVADATSGMTTMKASENTNIENNNDVTKLQNEKAMVDILRTGVIYIS